MQESDGGGEIDKSRNPFHVSVMQCQLICWHGRCMKGPMNLLILIVVLVILFGGGGYYYGGVGYGGGGLVTVLVLLLVLRLLGII
jgi:hypothetical protein